MRPDEARRVAPDVSATATPTPERATFSRDTPVLPFPGVDVMGLTTIALLTLVKDESKMETEPTARTRIVSIVFLVHTLEICSNSVDTF